MAISNCCKFHSLAAGCILCASGIFLSGCATIGPDYKAENPALPDQWHQQIQNELKTPEAPLNTWWQLFKDPELDKLISATRSGNLNLKIALERIEEANILLGISKGALLPTAAADGKWLENRQSQILNPLAPRESDDFQQLGMGASWEIDFWGKIRRQVESASASRQAMIENHRDALVLLQAQTASAYLQLRTLQQRLVYAQENAKTQQDTLKLTQDRLDAGLARELDIHQAELNLAITRSMIPTLQTGIAEQLNLLCVLTGQHSGKLEYLKHNFKGIPSPAGGLPAMLPAELLRQRPDLRAAERMLAAQHARIGAAKGELYPMFSLSGEFGWQTLNPGQFFNGAGRYYGMGPAVRWNLFSGQRLRNAVKAEESRTKQARLNYENAVLKAVQECENNFTGYLNEQQHEKLLVDAVKAARLSVNQVNNLYRNGLTDFQNVLDMERALTQQQDGLAVSRGLLSTRFINIYKSLGGGWSQPADSKAPSQAK